jgi:glycosyltransferase involved in cell wall biosynthesis
MTSERFVTAAAGRRDAYQIPLALALEERLEQFITTFYLTARIEKMLMALLGQVPQAAATRRSRRIPDTLIRPLIIPELLEQIGRRTRVSPRFYWRAINQMVSTAAGRAAARTQAHLLLYEPYAYEAFTRTYPKHNPRKILFHFHPHPALEAEIYAEDHRRFPPKTPWLTPDSGGRPTGSDQNGSSRAWRHAELILCASSFTCQSLVRAGADAKQCRVVPYGIDTSPTPPNRANDGVFRPIFVGTGIQRKGLHHLLAAWQIAKLPAAAELTLVCRTIDPQLEAIAATTPNCRLLHGVSPGELEQLYLSASLLVVPSLAEGFGQVYLEALAQGCPVLGSANSGLPDLGGEENGIFLTRPSDVAHLAETLERLASGHVFGPQLSQAAWETARRFSWDRFRATLLNAIQ